MTDRLNMTQRVRVLEALERISFELADIAAWLSRLDADAPAVMLEDAARNVAAAGWVVETPVRSRLPGVLAAGIRPARANGAAEPDWAALAELADFSG